MKKVKSKYLICLLLLFIFTGCGDVVMQYKMDECTVDSSHLVKDSSDTKNDAVPKHGNGNTDGKYATPCKDVRAIVCNNLWFRGEGYNAEPNNSWYAAKYYLEASDKNEISPLAEEGEMTLVGWFKTTKSSGTIVAKHNEYRVFIDGGNIKVTIWDKYGSPTTKTIRNSVNDGSWHFFAFTASVSGIFRKTLSLDLYYGDGSSNQLKKDTESESIDGVKNTSNPLIIGAMLWDGNNPTDYFDGYLDEIGMAKIVEDEDKLQKLYKAQKNHKDLNQNGNEEERTCECSCIGCFGTAAYDINLVQGGTAENSSDIDKWDIESGQDFARANYNTNWAGSAPPTSVDPQESSNHYFFFGDYYSVTVSQVIDVCNLANDIDTGLVDYNLSAYHGGYGDGDTIEIKAEFLDEDETVLGSYTTGTFTSNKDMQYFEKLEKLPKFTRRVKIYLVLDRKRGTDADGYADNISFVLHKKEIALNQCYFDNFNRTKLEDKWTVIKEKNYTPQIESNKLMLTKNDKNIATGITLSGKFPSADNYVEIEFEENAYGNGGNGADGITVTLADASVVDPLIDTNVSNIAGAYGGSLGYAQRRGIHGFKGGWLGIGLDEFGNYSNPTEGRIGGPGKKKDAVAIRGHWDENDESKGYEYITGTDTLSPGIDANTAQNYRYKISIDTRNSTQKIKIERDIRDGNGYQTIIDWTDINQSDATPPENFKLSFTGSTGGAKNYHSIDDLDIKAISCGTLGEEQNETVKNYKFDAWDTFRDINDRNISTKISNKNFELFIASLDENGTNLQDFNGTVCAKIDDVVTKVQFNSENIKNATFNVNKALKDIRVELSWKRDADENCPLSSEDNSTVSTDNFAIRPDKFILNLPTSLTSARSFIFDVKAQTNGITIQDYNTTLSDINITMNDNVVECEAPNADFNLTEITFEDGKSNENARFDDVGVVDVNITDREWAKVDENDTNATCDGYLICGSQSAVNIIPDHFEINSTMTNMNGTFTYLDRNLTQYSKLDINITAQNEANQTTQNYTALCYASSVGIDIEHEGVPSDFSEIWYIYQDALDINSTIEKKNKISISLYGRNNFTDDNNGTAPIIFYINFDRKKDKGVNPFDLNITNIHVQDKVDTTVEGDGVPNGYASYYYGRVKTKDIITNKQTTSHSLHVEVYSDNESDLVDGYFRESLNWYVMGDDDYTSDINMSAKKDFSGNNDEPDVILLPNSVNIANGKAIFDISNSWNSSNKAYIHVDIPSYLWYSRYEDYRSSGDCAKHPCFVYEYRKANSGEKYIKSGDFKGTAIDNDFNATIIRRGVKTFR